MHEIGVLKHVSYVLEAFAGGTTSEGKRELTVLIAHVERDSVLAKDCQAELLRRLRSAQKAVTEPDAYRGTLIELASATSYMWERVLPGWPYDSAKED